MQWMYEDQKEMQGVVFHMLHDIIETHFLNKMSLTF